LFFKLSDYQNEILFSQEELKNIAVYLQNFSNLAKKNNKDFYFVIAPDKDKIYGEYYPNHIKKARPDKKNKTFQLVKYLKENTDVNVIYSYNTLHSHKGEGLLYWKQDTHWNPLGAYYGYKELENEICKRYEISPLNLQEREEFRGQADNDIAKMNRSYVKKDDGFYVFPKINTNLQEVPFSGYDMSASNPYVNENGKYRLYLLGDSFGDRLMPYFTAAFHKVYFSGTDKFNLEAFEDSDIVVFECVERYISGLGYRKFT
jgi:hypothetical protein